MARSVILIPYRKPIASAGPNKMFERIGDSSLMFVIWGWNIKNIISAVRAAEPKMIRFRYFGPLDLDKSYSQLYTFEGLQKQIKEIIQKHLFKLSNLIKPYCTNNKEGLGMNFMN